jgi:16S rRNA (adenine1518-N6/adenine1519-N6)-dimethyltransferase
MSHFKAPPKKQLGQHFLTDRNVIAQILLAIDPRPGERLVEIGPGQARSRCRCSSSTTR